MNEAVPKENMKKVERLRFQVSPEVILLTIIDMVPEFSRFKSISSWSSRSPSLGAGFLVIFSKRRVSLETTVLAGVCTLASRRLIGDICTLIAPDSSHNIGLDSTDIS